MSQMSSESVEEAVCYTGWQKSQKEETENDEDKKIQYSVENALELAYYEYFRAESIDDNEARLRCLLLGINFVIPARPYTFLDGIIDTLK